MKILNLGRGNRKKILIVEVGWSRVSVTRRIAHGGGGCCTKGGEGGGKRGRARGGRVPDKGNRTGLERQQRAKWCLNTLGTAHRTAGFTLWMARKGQGAIDWLYRNAAKREYDLKTQRRQERALGIQYRRFVFQKVSWCDRYQGVL